MTAQSQVAASIPSDYDIFAGHDVDQRSIAMTLSNHKALLKSLRLHYSSEQLLIMCASIFRSNEWSLFMKPGPPASASTMI